MSSRPCRLEVINSASLRTGPIKQLSTSKSEHATPSKAGRMELMGSSSSNSEERNEVRREAYSTQSLSYLFRATTS